MKSPFPLKSLAPNGGLPRKGKLSKPMPGAKGTGADMHFGIKDSKFNFNKFKGRK